MAVVQHLAGQFVGRLSSGPPEKKIPRRHSTLAQILRYFSGSQNAVCGPLRSRDEGFQLAAFRLAIQLEVRLVCVIIIN